MTREEEIQNACKTSIKETITCSGYGFTDRATDLLECAFEKGARWADETMINNACEWLKDMACIYAHWEYNGDTYEKEIVFYTEKLIKDFKKAMEE
jgi:hypothetical protein